MNWSFRRQTVVRKRSVDELAASQPAVVRTLSDLGYAPQRAAEMRRILTQIKAGIKTQIPDFAAFQEHVKAAAQIAAQDPRPTAADKQLLERLITASSNREAVLAILDHDPVEERLLFIELVPVKRGTGTAWLAPVAEPPLLRRPVNSPQFAELLDELESLFRDPHPAVQDAVRVQVIDGIHRVRRELDRAKGYLVSAIQVLERRIGVYESTGHEPDSRVLLDILLKIIDDVESARSQIPSNDGSRQRLSRAAERYLGHPRLYSRWMTNNLVDNLLAPAQIQSASRRSGQSRKVVELIRDEIAGSHFNASEIARRLRTLERDGLYFSSLVYCLLALDGERLASRVARRNSSIANV